jgi:hypothetical protein
MNISQILQASAVLRPLVATAQVGSQQWGACWTQSALGQTLNRLVAPITGGLARLSNWIPCPHWGLLAVLLLLGLACCTATTGIIGVLTLGLITLDLVLIQHKALGRFQPSVVDGLVLLLFASVLLSTAFSSYRVTSMIGLAKLGLFFGGYLGFRVVLSQLLGQPLGKPQSGAIKVMVGLLSGLMVLGCY